MSSSREERVQKICQSLQRNDSDLTEICLRDFRLGDDGAKAIAATLANNTHLTRLILNGCSITEVGLTAIANGLQNNVSVKVLDLGENTHGEASSAAIGAMLAVNQTLKELELVRSFLTDSNAILIARRLQQNEHSQLRSLDMDENWIGNGGAIEFGEVLKWNQSLTNLRLSNNNVGDDGAKGLASALPINNQLKALYLERNNIGWWGAKALREGLKDNFTLCDLPYCTEIAIYEMMGIEFFLSLNRYGRRLVKITNVHPSLWSVMLAKVGRYYYRRWAASMIYYFLCQRPDLCSFHTANNRKRKRSEEE